ncbi:MAG: lysozyme inhibitor LprI family protein [Lachnospiraceae bacterium]|nr:lysozyme inhibitor LprI family protein [Lachnospiraceae bacterium]
MKKLLGLLVISIFVLSACGKQEKPAEDASSNLVSKVMEELEVMTKVDEEYEASKKEDVSQAEMSEKAGAYCEKWEEELDTLWDEIGDSLSDEIKAEQDTWNKVVDPFLEDMLQDYSDGSIYPMLYAQEKADLMRNRVYKLASQYAKDNGETIEYTNNDIRQKFLNYENNAIKDILYITDSMESGYVAKINIDGVGSLEGTATQDGDKIVFQTYEETLKGEISLEEDKAVFLVTESTDGTFKAGDEFTFAFRL